MKEKIKNIDDRIEKIKDSMRNDNFNADDTGILLLLKDVPDDLNEIIILMHTYNKHNLTMMKNDTNVVIKDILSITEKITEIANEIYSDVSKAKAKLFTVRNLPYIVGTVLVILILIWIAYVIDPVATKYVVDIFGSAFESIKKNIVTAIFKM